VALVPANVKQTLIDEMGVLIGYIVDVESFPTESDVDERISRTFNLMNQCRVMGEQEVYLRLIHTVVDLHLRLRNFGEAAMALGLHIQVLQWNEFQQLPSFMGLPTQTSGERRALLMRRAIDLFGAANMWERAIEMCRQVATYYEARFKYDELADVISLQTQFLRNILDPSRIFSTFWFVSFYGPNIPAHLRDKEFISSRPPTETWNSFADKLRLEFPNARLYNTILSKQDAAQLPACICGVLVEPYPEENQTELDQQLREDPTLVAPSYVKAARAHENLKRFRAVFRVAEGDAEYVLTTKDPFPSVLTRLPLAQKRVSLLASDDTGLAAQRQRPVTPAAAVPPFKQQPGVSAPQPIPQQPIAFSVADLSMSK
jgi:hypothetical protein